MHLHRPVKLELDVLLCQPIVCHVAEVRSKGIYQPLEWEGNTVVEYLHSGVSTIRSDPCQYWCIMELYSHVASSDMFVCEKETHTCQADDNTVPGLIDLCPLSTWL